MNEKEMLKLLERERDKANIREDVQGDGKPVTFWIGFKAALDRMREKITDALLWEDKQK